MSAEGDWLNRDMSDDLRGPPEGLDMNTYNREGYRIVREAAEKMYGGTWDQYDANAEVMFIEEVWPGFEVWLVFDSECALPYAVICCEGDWLEAWYDDPEDARREIYAYVPVWNLGEIERRRSERERVRKVRAEMERARQRREAEEANPHIAAHVEKVRAQPKARALTLGLQAPGKASAPARPEPARPPTPAPRPDPQPVRKAEPVQRPLSLF